ERDRVLCDGRRRAGLNVARRAQLERDAVVTDPGREPAEMGAGPAEPVAPAEQLDVVDDPDAVPEPVGAADLDGLPDARQPERLTRMDGEVEVLAVQVVERV